MRTISVVLDLSLEGARRLGPLLKRLDGDPAGYPEDYTRLDPYDCSLLRHLAVAIEGEVAIEEALAEMRQPPPPTIREVRQ